MAVNRTTPSYAAASLHAARLWARVINAAQLNLMGYGAWLMIHREMLREQFFASNEVNCAAWYQHRYERDMGLLMAESNGNLRRTTLGVGA